MANSYIKSNWVILRIVRNLIFTRNRLIIELVRKANNNNRTALTAWISEENLTVKIT